MNKFYYNEDHYGMEHYYKINNDNTGIHVNKSSLLINDYPRPNNENIGQEITEEVFNAALEETLTKLGLTLGLKPFKF